MRRHQCGQKKSVSSSWTPSLFPITPHNFTSELEPVDRHRRGRNRGVGSSFSGRWDIAHCMLNIDRYRGAGMGLIGVEWGRVVGMKEGRRVPQRARGGLTAPLSKGLPSRGHAQATGSVHCLTSQATLTLTAFSPFLPSPRAEKTALEMAKAARMTPPTVFSS